jgi:hypothetical protein
MFAGDAGMVVVGMVVVGIVEVGALDEGADRADDAQPARSTQAPSSAIASLLERDRYVVSCVPQGLVA